MTPNPTLITYCNSGYAPFAINLLLNLIKNVKNHRLHFYCLDQELYDMLTRNFGHHPLFTFQRVEAGVSKNFENYGSPLYNQITHTKMSVLRDALDKYKFIHFIDCDIVCVNEPPSDFYDSFKQYDIVFQYDNGWMYNNGPLHPMFNNWVCTGNTTLRDGPGTRYILDKIEAYQARGAGNDQDCLKKYFDEAGVKDIRKEPNAKLYVYPIEFYTNGFVVNHGLFTTKDTHFFHANHVAGSAQKRDLLKKIGEWYLTET
jgi:hypothetical protein